MQHSAPPAPLKLGTPQYMAPELLLDFRAPDTRADVFSFGCVLLFVITRDVPWPNVATEEELRCAIRSRREQGACLFRWREDFPWVFAQVPRALVLLMEECTALEPDARPQMTSVLAALQEAKAWMVDHGPPLEWLALRTEGEGEGEGDRVELEASSKLFVHISGMLHGVMGGCAVSKVEMNCNRRLHQTFSMERARVARENGGCANERWLWHGCRSPDAVAGILATGFKSQNVNLDFNFYGAGTYFAPDPRLSDHYARYGASAGGSQGEAGSCQLLLCRVVCGRVGDKEALTDNGRTLIMSDPQDKEIMR